MKRLLLLLLLLGGAVGPVSAVIDPFYQNRMQSGVQAFEEGNWEEAARQLRIACFGHLDEPVTLSEGLMRLAVAEATLGDEDAFRRTFSRLTELEERFSAYSAARVPASLRQQFEGLVARLISAQSLRTADGFQAIADRAEVQRLAAMPPEQRRAELEARLQAEPQRADLLIAMAKLELELRRPRPALDWLDRLPPAVQQIPPATCLRQQAGSESGDCAQLDLAGPFCRDVPPSVVEFRLQCLIEEDRWLEASALIRGLDPQLRTRRRITRMERKVRQNIGESNVVDLAADDASAAGVPSSDQAEAAPPAAAPPTEPTPTAGPVDAQELERLRERLADAETGDELAALRSAAESFAQRHPGARAARLLAAEIAYLQSDWPAAVSHFQGAGDMRSDEAELAFYRAVALYESGDPAAAAAVLQPVVSRLERTSFVDTYVERILAPGV